MADGRPAFAHEEFVRIAGGTERDPWIGPESTIAS
jgi:hypothetical protein